MLQPDLQRFLAHLRVRRAVEHRQRVVAGLDRHFPGRDVHVAHRAEQLAGKLQVLVAGAGDDVATQADHGGAALLPTVRLRPSASSVRSPLAVMTDSCGRLRLKMLSKLLAL